SSRRRHTRSKRDWSSDVCSSDLVKESLENVQKNRVEHLVTIKQQDIFELDLARADVITLYLLPRLNVKLIPQLDKLKPGCRIVRSEERRVGKECRAERWA